MSQITQASAPKPQESDPALATAARVVSEHAPQGFNPLIDRVWVEGIGEGGWVVNSDDLRVRDARGYAPCDQAGGTGTWILVGAARNNHVQSVMAFDVLG